MYLFLSLTFYLEYDIALMVLNIEEYKGDNCN